MRLADLVPPATPAARAASAVLDRFCDAPLAAHCRRSWLFCLAFAEVDGVAITDPEALHVAALLHDVGLAPEFDAVWVPFEHAGGAVAWAVAAGAGWDADRCDRTARIVELHMAPVTDPGTDPEGHLLDVATGLDISGARAHALPEDLLREVLRALPRDGLAASFGPRVLDQAIRKPGSQACRVAPTALRALADHPLDRLS